MKTYYETIFDTDGDWACWLIVTDDSGVVERNINESGYPFYYCTAIKGIEIERHKQWVRERNNTKGVAVFYLITDTPCTGERNWFASACQDNGIEDYRIFRACWEAK